MKPLRKFLDRVKPHFEPGGKLQAFRSVFDGMETFLYTPRSTSRSGVHIHDSIDSKRTMIIVVMALLPCFIFGMYNTGYQHWLAAGEQSMPFWSLMLYGFLAVIPRVVVCYLVGLGIEFIVAQWRKEEIQEGFLVTGILIPMICPIETPVWMLAVATAFSVIFAKEVFGGTGYNIFNIALITRAFLFFAYPAQMSGDKAFVATGTAMGYGPVATDGFTCATHIYMGCVPWAYPWLVRRDIYIDDPDRGCGSAYKWNRQLEGHAVSVCRRVIHGVDCQYGG